MTSPHESEIVIPFLGIKVRGAAIKSIMPFSGWIVAVAVGVYGLTGPVMAALTRLEARVDKLETQVKRNGDSVEDLGKDIRRLYRRGEIGGVSMNTEISSVRPTPTRGNP